MTVNIPRDKFGSAKITTLNDSIINTLDITNNSIINFYEITTDSLNPIHLLLKSPDFLANGHIHFARSNFDPYFSYFDKPLDT